MHTHMVKPATNPTYTHAYTTGHRPWHRAGLRPAHAAADTMSQGGAGCVQGMGVLVTEAIRISNQRRGMDLAWTDEDAP